jgi:RNA polymerase sigma-70 factor (ECF subfamily)
LDEKLLVRRAAHGDRDAFAQLLERYQKQVYHHALRMTGDPEDAADLTQETFLKVWQGLAAFQGDCAFSTWLYRVTGNVCIDFLRREKKRWGDLSLDDDEGALCAVLPDTAPSPQRALEAKEQAKSIQAGLLAISPEHRQVLVLREVDGLSYEEIGQALGLSVGTVKSRIARARLNLAKFLKKSGNFSGSSSSTHEE